MRSEAFARVIEVECHAAGVDIHERGHVAEEVHGSSGGPGGIGGRQNLAAAGQIQGEEGREQRSGAVAVGFCVRNSQGVLQFRLEQRNLLIKTVVVEKVKQRLLLLGAVSGPAGHLSGAFLGNPHGSGPSVDRQGLRGTGRRGSDGGSRTGANE